MNFKQTISFQTQIDAKSIGYNDFPIEQEFITSGTVRNTCTLEMLHEWIKENYHMTIDVECNANEMWRYILRWCDGYGVKTITSELTYIDNSYSYYKTGELAFDAGLSRAIREIKNNLIYQ